MSSAPAAAMGAMRGSTSVSGPGQNAAAKTRARYGKAEAAHAHPGDWEEAETLIRRALFGGGKSTNG